MKASNRNQENSRKKALAYTLFTENGFEQKVIASITGITEKTISAWKKADKAKSIDWEVDRDELKQGFDKERRRIKKHINTILDEIEKRNPPHNVPNSTESDSINKLASAADKLQTSLAHAHKTETGKQFIAYIQQVHGQAKAIEIVDLWHEFLMSTS